MTSWNRFQAGVHTGGIVLRTATPEPSHKVNVYQGSRWEHEEQQSLRCQDACKAAACTSSDGKNAAGPSISRAGSAIAAVHADAALTADDYPALHGAAPAVPRGIWATRLAAASAAATPAIPAPLTTPAIPAADAASTVSEPCSPAGPCTPAAADAACSPFASDVAACTAMEPAAPWQIPARRRHASDHIQAGCCYDPATVTLYARIPAADSCPQLPEPTTTTPLTSAPAKAIAPYVGRYTSRRTDAPVLSRRRRQRRASQASPARGPSSLPARSCTLPCGQQPPFLFTAWPWWAGLLAASRAAPLYPLHQAALLPCPCPELPRWPSLAFALNSRAALP